MLNSDEQIRFINLFSKFTKVPKKELFIFLESNDMSNLLKRPQSLTLEHKQLEKISEINELRQLMYVGLQTTKEVIDSPKSIYNNLIKFADFTDKEYFIATFLNTKNHIIKTEVMNIGTHNASLINVKDLSKKAILCDAAQIIVSHNHPSGDPKPSQEDIEITKKIYSALKMMDVELLDHIILGEGTFLSFKEKGLFASMPSMSSLLAENDGNIYSVNERNDDAKDGNKTTEVKMKDEKSKNHDKDEKLGDSRLSIKERFERYKVTPKIQEKPAKAVKPKQKEEAL